MIGMVTIKWLLGTVIVATLGATVHYTLGQVIDTVNLEEFSRNWQYAQTAIIVILAGALWRLFVLFQGFRDKHDNFMQEQLKKEQEENAKK